MKKQEVINTMREWFFPNFFDIDMFDYTQLDDDEVYLIYLQEKDLFGGEIDEMLEEQHHKGIA